MSRANGWTDEEVMRSVRAGEVSLVAVLFERHHRKLFGFCWRMTGSVASAEDLVQEVFLRVLRHRETYGDHAAFTSWLYSIARNAHADSWRKRSRETALDAAVPPSSTASVEELQEQARLHRALLELPEDKREVLVMNRFLGMSHAEIAEALGCDEITSRTRVHRALGTLRDIFLRQGSTA